MRTNTARARMVGTILMGVFLLASAAAVCAVGESDSQEVQKVRIPRTAEEHRAMAQSYRLKAIAYEREAQTHRLMCEEYQFRGFLPFRLMGEHSIKEAQNRCERYMRDAQELAENARGLAEYHEAQAKALSGQSVQ